MSLSKAISAKRLMRLGTVKGTNVMDPGSSIQAYKILLWCSDFLVEHPSRLHCLTFVFGS